MPTSPAPRLRPPRGFSLAEMLVVIGVIGLLVAISLVAITKVRRSGQIARIKSDLVAVSVAIEQFKNDHKGLPGMVPGVPQNVPIHNALAWCLVSPGPASGPNGDGAEGPGFRVAGLGVTKAWPAYLDADKFKVKLSGRGWELLDVFGSPIIYLPKRKPNLVQAATRGAGPILANYPAAGTGAGPYDANDVAGALTNPPQTDDARKGLLMSLGDRNADNTIGGAGESLRYSGEFILMSAGPDAQFFLPDANFDKSDDVYNFDR